MRNFSNIDRYLDMLEGDIYPEPDLPQHEDITGKVFQNYIIPNKQALGKVLDVGCGQGLALKRFKSLGIDTIGITLGKEDYEACLRQGYHVKLMDQSFLDFPDETFDLVYARHVLEHSIFPLVTLFEFNRVLRKGGFLYVEVPRAESGYTKNPNHYSVFGKMSWRHLLNKSGLAIIHNITINFDLIDGEVDEYWGWWLQKWEDFPLKSKNNGNHD